MKNNYWIKKYKYKYCHKQLYRLKGITKGDFLLNSYNTFFLKTLDSVFLKASQIEASRRVIRHFIKKFIKITINLSCSKSISEKSNGTRMGKGKGSIKEWVMPVNKGRILFNIKNINTFQASLVCKKAIRKYNFCLNFSKNLIYKSNFLNDNLYY